MSSKPPPSPEPPAPELVDWQGLAGRLFVISGPSGSGKSTLARRAVEHPAVRAGLSVSATTRAPRPGEREGVDYFFLPRDQFEAARDRGEFLEWAEVFGQCYGTPVRPVETALRQGTCVLLEIDVQGGLQVRRRVPSVHLIFVNAPDPTALEARLRGRGSDDEPTIRRRLDKARWETEQAAAVYQTFLVNGDLEQAVEELVALLTGLGCGGTSPDAGRIEGREDRQ